LSSEACAGAVERVIREASAHAQEKQISRFRFTDDSGAYVVEYADGSGYGETQ
jgi:hypothetical protein